ncbi:hypothetical protein A2372_04280 [Candidatus Wolfebacteria bacterium RIFOXYB1_FULL_54_12]|uniref:DedA family protein n=1 Tax=Candidatus Wolfebacteria bacterium RIFOXYB1_FULL_54_12 TaxID=1802559 RepID=A0A1F8DX42_9BACT|nr:MAG: hypothetical protein A2372_04280 [Candidatus Wolfebacteria bacterium RIFOXYB1_FULL_54_12]
MIQNMETLLLQFTQIGLIATYMIVFLGMFIEGEMFLILAGILVRGQVIDFMDTILVAFCAVILHDIGYWAIGMKVGAGERKKLWILDVEKMEKTFKKLQKREGLYIFMSKFAWGMNRFMLMSSGYFKTPFKKLIKYSIPAAFIWTTTFVSVGYVFAERAELWKKDIKTVAIFTTLFFLGMIYVESLVSRSIKEDAQLPNGDR